MPNFNKVILMGNLTRDIELRYTQSGTAVCDVGLAINRKWGDKEETCFVDCTAWGKTAEVMAEYLEKGRPVLIEGRLTQDSWEKDGKRFSKIKVTIEGFQFVGGGGGGKSASREERKPVGRGLGDPDDRGDGSDSGIPF